MTDFTIRQLHTMQDITATVELQQAIWHMPASLCASPYTMIAATDNGGSVFGAESGGQLVGFCFAFAGLRDGQPILWSHMAGVRPGYQGQGIGFKLKQVQREWALAQGYDCIGWTFDPMQRGNASFSFNRLGAIARTYKPDAYGAMPDTINVGLASDRLEALWLIELPRVVALAQTAALPASDMTLYPPKAFAVWLQDEDTLSMVRPAKLTANEYFIEIPYRLTELKQEDLPFAAEWQRTIRDAMLHLLSNGYIVADFIRIEERCWYVLRREQEEAS